MPSEPEPASSPRRRAVREILIYAVVGGLFIALTLIEPLPVGLVLATLSAAVLRKR